MPLINRVFLVLLLFPTLACSADLAREKRIAEQIENVIFDGGPVYLKDGVHEFLSIHMRTEQSPALGGVIVLHGLGANPDWVDVVQPLRIGLTEHGWETLSIQAPVAREGANESEWDATVPEATPRIDAALAFLKQRNILNVAIVAHSHGARMAAHYLANQQPEQVQAFVAVGMSANPSDRTTGNLAALRKIKLPILDLYGELDLPQVKDTARERRLAARDAENERYRQTEVAGADHFFANHSELLLAKVRAWLAREAGGSETPLK